MTLSRFIPDAELTTRQLADRILRRSNQGRVRDGDTVEGTRRDEGGNESTETFVVVRDENEKRAARDSEGRVWPWPKFIGLFPGGDWQKVITRDPLPDPIIRI